MSLIITWHILTVFGKEIIAQGSSLQEAAKAAKVHQAIIDKYRRASDVYFTSHEYCPFNKWAY